MVVPVGPAFNNYGQEVRDKLRNSGFCVDVDVDDGNTMNKKVRNAQIAQYNFIFGKLQIVEIFTDKNENVIFVVY